VFLSGLILGCVSSTYAWIEVGWYRMGLSREKSSSYYSDLTKGL